MKVGANTEMSLRRNVMLTTDGHGYTRMNAMELAESH